MIPRSTTLTAEGRRLRERLWWALGTFAALAVLAFAFMALERSSVVDGPTGSSFATTATGTAALHDTLARTGRDPVRLREPLSPALLTEVDTYVVSDVEFGQYEQAELDALASFVDAGGRAVIAGVPPRALLESFDTALRWAGTPVGDAEVHVPMANVEVVRASRFGSFPRDHAGERIAGSADRDLAVRFGRGAGSVVFVADSSIAHNATIDQADNIDFLGEIIEGRAGFDEFRHGYRTDSSGGLVAAAPGNWSGALLLGGITLVLALIGYGRRFGPVEPQGRPLVPDRGTYVDAVARSLRRAKGPIPVAPLRAAVTRRLRIAPDADGRDIADAARRLGLPADLLDALEHGGVDDPYVMDRALATLSTERGHPDDRHA